MTASSTDSNDELPFSYDERLLIRSSSTGAKKASPSTSTKTVRLESLAQWKEDSWIRPFSDIDLGLSSGSNNLYKQKISRVEMSISSHGAQRFPNSSNGLDHIPTLPLWSENRNNEGSQRKVRENERYLSKPQGFFLSIRPVDGLTLEEEARAVQAVFQELIRSRVLTTPVTGGEWDVVEEIEGGRLYQLVLPFDGAAWSGDALAQSFRRTVPEVCDENKGNEQFFGWSALQWSNFLVGYKDGGGELGQGDTQSFQHITFNKLMWWTWASTPSENNDKIDNGQSISFGIQYQTTISVDAHDWLPDAFLDETSKCPVGKRTAFKVLSRAGTNTANSYQLVPISGENEDTARDEQASSSNFSYSVGIEQVLRRHHTNLGRFESSIDLHPLFDIESDNSISCQLKYRQLFPNFLSPMWRTLRITNNDNGDTATDVFYSNSDQLQASVTWNQDDQSSTLTVEAFSHEKDAGQTQLPSNVFISLEYNPSFLTIDDFPGDPNRGRVLPPARVTIQCYPSTKEQSTNTIVYSNSLLLLPPVPDLSMPFNVISLTSSLYAYIIGAIITILVRKGSEKIKYTIYPDKKPVSKMTKIKTKLREKFGGIKSKVMGNKDANSEKNSTQELTSEIKSKAE